jgi:hypothetical protein
VRGKKISNTEGSKQNVVSASTVDVVVMFRSSLWCSLQCCDAIICSVISTVTEFMVIVPSVLRRHNMQRHQYSDRVHGHCAFSIATP